MSCRPEYLRTVEPPPPAGLGEDQRDGPGEDEEEEEDSPRVSMPKLMTYLDSQKIADLPDGGGLASM